MDHAITLGGLLAFVGWLAGILMLIVGAFIVFAAVILAIAAGLWWFGIIPWWGVLIAVPVVTVGLIGGLIVIGILAWMAGGSH